MQSTLSTRPAPARLRPVAHHQAPNQPASSRMSAALAVLRMAATLDPDPLEAMAWYRNVPIAVLDGLTAAELVNRGRASAVLAFLRAAIEVELADARRLA